MWTSYISNKKQWTSSFGEKYSPSNMRTSYALPDGDSIRLNLYTLIDHAVSPKKWLERDHNEYEFQIYINGIDNFK
jgi:hypothetical protein